MVIRLAKKREKVRNALACPKNGSRESICLCRSNRQKSVLWDTRSAKLRSTQNRAPKGAAGKSAEEVFLWYG